MSDLSLIGIQRNVLVVVDNYFRYFRRTSWVTPPASEGLQAKDRYCLGA